MAINYENKYETERRINTPAIKKTVDKLYGAMYNEGNKSTKSDVGNYAKKQPTEPDTTKRFGFAPEINSWAKKNQDAIRYAGDGAINSIKKASNDYLNEYLKDAPEDTDKDELFGSIAKWQLARDANDEKRGNVARNNIIGHMSTENKSPYLKEQIPFSEYVKAKDDFDYKTGKYTTTEYSSTNPDETVKGIQQKLNENGYTDKYGNKLKVDGTVGSKTLQAYDSYENDLKNKERAKQTDNYFDADTLETKKLVPDEHQNQDVLALNKGMKLASAGGPVYLPEFKKLNYTESTNVLNSAKISYDQLKERAKSIAKETKDYFDYTYDRLMPTSKDGVLSEADKDEERNPLKQKMIKAFSSLWKRKVEDRTREISHTQADKYREFDDNNFNRAIYLNSSDSASGNGHNAVMLINKDDYAIVFSFYPVTEELPDVLLSFAEVRFAVLTPDEMNNVLYGDGEIKDMIASDGGVKDETYDRHIYYDISNGQGYNMYHSAVNLFDWPGFYMLVGRQCDNVAQDILEAGGIDLKRHFIPNNSYEYEKRKWV